MSAENLRKQIQALTCNDGNEVADKLTRRVMKQFISRIAMDIEKEKMMKKKKIKRCQPGIRINGKLQNKNSSRKGKEIMVVREKVVKRCHGSFLEEEEKDDEELRWIKKQKKAKAKAKTKTKKKQRKTGAEDQIQKKKIISSILEKLDANPIPMPENFRKCIEELGGIDINLVMHKVIYDTDLSKTHSRLSMTIKKFLNKFFSDDEERKFRKGKESKEVKLVEPCLKVSKVNMTWWAIGGSHAFVFNNQWNQIVVDNPDTLKTMAIFQIWSFWIPRELENPELGFALIKVGDVPDKEPS
ncbi:hypothetical protein CCACVL1_05142 [Corchorus capsularis]|uniref:B3 domain-containing protein n=1 Tax=Corchorus capsularis TaxID=210143 RepID=A0A1R3JMC2_COCAP|nr:hypothetical protein CCACVL1_05142 [Corchorus capsularis]